MYYIDLWFLAVRVQRRDQSSGVVERTHERVYRIGDERRDPRALRRHVRGARRCGLRLELRLALRRPPRLL